jgi:lysophospholipase L1-like esterase
MGKLFFVGDSITVGAWDEKGGWASRLSGQILHKTMNDKFSEPGFYCLPYNLGVSGDTIADVLPRLEREIMPRLDQDDPEEAVQIVFAIGVNDSCYMVEEGRPCFTDEEFRHNLEEMVATAQKITQRISFIGLMPVDDDLLNPMPWAPEKAYMREHVQRYEAIIEAVCGSHDLPFLPLFEKWLSMPDYKSYLFDGIHPNSKGHELLAAQIAAFIFNDDFETFHSE